MAFLESLFWLTLNVYHEARSEPEIGQLAVAHVTLNRAAAKQKTIPEVILAPKQFSWTFQKESYVPLELNALQTSLHVAMQALVSPDFTQGATFYHHVNVNPKWAASLDFVARYGTHKFYRDTPPQTSAANF